MSEKDPAVLFYSTDWLEGTSEMTSEEKGVYIDLLASQHQRGSLPTDTKRLCKLARLGEAEFLSIWADISHKFKTNGEGRLVNRKLTKVVTERLEKGHKNKIISALAVAVRQSNLPYEVKYEAKKGFNVLDFINIPEPNITETVTEWFNSRLKSIENANGNEDANGNAIIYNNSSIVFKMFEIFKKFNLEYFEDKTKDATAIYQIALKIAKTKSIEQHEMINGKMNEILTSWGKIVNFIVSDTWFRTRCLFDINNEWQRLIQSMTNNNGAKNNNGTKSKLGNKSGGFSILTEALNKNG
jgi:uncharacterized protein YdaU (DUF1376 family)